jgi:hypothetical protein
MGFSNTLQGISNLERCQVKTLDRAKEIFEEYEIS